MRAWLPAGFLAWAVAAAAAEVAEVVADRAQVSLDDGRSAIAEKGRWFGVGGRNGDSLPISFFDGERLRQGSIRSRDTHVVADADVDIAAEALKVAKELRPSIDVRAYKARLDALAQRLAVTGDTVREKAASLAALLFEREGFAPGEPHTLDAVLDGRKGNCLGLSLLYLCVARKARVPVRLVTAPKHVFLQCGAGERRFFIETTRNGEFHDTPDYLRQHLGEQQMGEAGGIHLEALRAPQTVGVLAEELGRVLRDAERYPEALRHYARAIEINPRHAEAYVGLGAVLIGLGKLDAGLEACAKAAGLNRRDPEAYCYWGVALRRLGRHADACTQYAKAVELRPRFDKAYCNWGVALERMAKHKEACDKQAKALELNPRNADAHFNWGVALANLARFPQACAKFARADALKPRDAMTFFYWGIALVKVGKQAEGVGKLEAAAALSPDLKAQVDEILAKLPPAPPE